MHCRYITAFLIITTFGIPVLSYGQFAGGLGTEEDPYQVATVEQLQKIQNYTDKHFVQVNDIDASETVAWNDSTGFKPIGDDVVKFTGAYDGSGYIIDGLVIKRTSQNGTGLFGYIEEAKISNAKLVDITVLGNEYVGGLVGHIKKGTINNISVTGKVKGQNGIGGLVGFNGGYDSGIINNSNTNCIVLGGANVGGLVGVLQHRKIDSSYAVGNISGSNNIGGLVGKNESGKINNSYSKGDILGNAYVGGLVGQNGGFETGSINNSKATGDVSGKMYVGGLAGKSQWGWIRDSYTTGKVSAKEYVGGLVGQNVGADIERSFAKGNVAGTTRVGGASGYTSNSNIVETFATGKVNGADIIGGLIGENAGSEIRNSYATSSANGENDIGGLVGINNGEGIIITSYSTGKVLGSEDVGGLVGVNGATINSSYWNIDSTYQNKGIGRGSSDGATGLNYTQMIGLKSEQKMVAFKFDQVWGSIPNKYPNLLWSIPYFKITNLSSNAPITEGQTLKVDVEAKNIGGITDTMNIKLREDTTAIGSKSGIVLGADNSYSVKFQWQSTTGDKGNYAFVIETTHDKDTLKFTVQSGTGIINTKSYPEYFKLYNPYPTPFNPVTNIKYDLPKASDVSVKVYNILGRHIRTLINEKQSAGTHRVRFKAGNLPSGQYLIRLQSSNGFVAEKSVMLVK